MIRVPLEEQETVINIDPRFDTIHIWSSDPKMIRMFEKKGYIHTKEGRSDGDYWNREFDIPVENLRFLKSKAKEE